MITYICATVIAVVGIAIIVYCQKGLAECKSTGIQITGKAVDCKEELVQSPVQKKMGDVPIFKKDKFGNERIYGEKAYRVTYEFDDYSVQMYGCPKTLVDPDTSDYPVELEKTKEFFIGQNNKMYNEENLKQYRKSALFFLLLSAFLIVFELI